MSKWTLIKVRQDVDFYNNPVDPKHKPFAYRMIINPAFVYKPKTVKWNKEQTRYLHTKLDKENVNHDS